MRRQLLTFFAAALAGLPLGAGCGAELLQAPPPEPPADVRQCRSFDLLMPNFVKAIDQGKTRNLKAVVEGQLLTRADNREGAPPLGDVMRAIFSTITTFASQPPEKFAPSGTLCAADAALVDLPLSEANELCELRRALQVLVHQGKGVEAVKIVDPQVEILVDYITGQGTTCAGKPRVAHFEVAGLFSAMCGQTRQCQLSNGLDLIVGFSDYAYTAEGKAAVRHLNELAVKESILDLLDPAALSEEDAVSLARAFIPMIQAATAADLENAFTRVPLPSAAKTDLRPLVDDLKGILGHPELIGPVRNALACLVTTDKAYDLVRMVYQVAIAEKCSPFGLTRLTEVATGLQSVDQRGSLAFVAGALARAVRSDETAVDSGAQVCRLFFSTVRGQDQARSNAELVLPVIRDLVQDGLLSELICAADTVLFGCASGAQPACQ